MELPLGARRGMDGSCTFLVWAPKAEQVELHLLAPTDRVVAMRRLAQGYHFTRVENAPEGTRYSFRLDGAADRPDPASCYQPSGVHGPSGLLRSGFAWEDRGWFGLPLRDYIIYELHVGTFTTDGTFDAILPHLPELKDLGVTAIELMPVAQFPGSRNWGYDGVFPFAVQNSYGGPEGLKRLVNACHGMGLAVILDTVYNHLGPEGNYLAEFGPYFTESYRSSWGRGLNFDGEESDAVRRYFIENALYWQNEFHLDALRLDAVHAIRDFSATPFLTELARATRQQSERLNRRFYLIAESDLNMARLILPEAVNGMGLDAQWSDDFHHCLHAVLTGEKEGYYSDFGGFGMLTEAMRQGWVYDGRYSNHRRRRHGSCPQQLGARQLVVYAQNHDQVGNRMRGERLAALVDFERQKLAAGCVLLSPFVPLLFMGEEYGETAPFQYFISHTEAELVEAVRRGRSEEFAAFRWQGEVPDPQSERTFQQCVLDHGLRERGQHRVLREFYRELIQARKELPAIRLAEKRTVLVQGEDPGRLLLLLYRHERGSACVLLHFGDEGTEHEVHLPTGDWRVLLDSADTRWNGPGRTVGEHVVSHSNMTLKMQPYSLMLLLST